MFRSRVAGTLVGLATVVAGVTAFAPIGRAGPAVPHILVYSQTAGFRHTSITHAKEVVQQLAEETGRFTVEFSEDAAIFSPELYQRADAIYFLSTTGELPFSKAQKTDMLRYFACGGGYIGTHAAGDANYTWPDYIELVGAWFTSHPHGWGAGTASMIVEDQTNPSTRPWHGQETFDHSDEFYKWAVNPRGTQDLNVMFSLDETTSPQGSQYESHQPLGWTKTFRGLGRVAYSNIGHGDQVFDLPAWQDHFLGMIEWATEPGVDRECFGDQAATIVERSSADVRKPSASSVADTGAAVSRRIFDSAATAVVVAENDYASALAAAPLAAKVEGPLLVTTGNALSAETESEVSRLGAGEVIVVGDSSAVQDAVVTDLTNGADDRMGIPGAEGLPPPLPCQSPLPCPPKVNLNDDITVRRISGATPYETAAAVAAEFPAGSPAFVVDAIDDGTDGGREALAATGLAAARTQPILLTETDSLPPATDGAVADRSVTIVGGPGAVSATVQQALAGKAASVDRIAGGSRYGTSAATANAAIGGGTTPEVMWLASGRDNPVYAALAGAAAGTEGGVLLLVDGASLDGASAGWLRAHAADVHAVRVAGPIAEVGHEAVACAQQILLAPAGIRTGCGL
jgi:putative cell wall-binding protein/type 1 glutamine amidotransferase